MSNDSSVSNGNGSHERNNLEENEKEAFDGESSDYYEGMGVHEKTKLPKKATDILKTWFLNNIDHPYPTVETKEMLCKATGLNKKQVQNWFTNSRKVNMINLLGKLTEASSLAIFRAFEKETGKRRERQIQQSFTLHATSRTAK